MLTERGEEEEGKKRTRVFFGEKLKKKKK